MTETRVTTLGEFLLARIKEEKAAARSAQARSSYGLADSAFEEAVELAQGEGARKPALEHIALHDPARVLAECDAKTRIVDLHAAIPVATGPNSSLMVCLGCGDLAPCMTVRFLALPYVQHPDYQKGWLP